MTKEDKTLDFFRNSLWLRKLMIFEQIYRQILKAYINIWLKNLAIKMPKMAILTTKWGFERSLLSKSAKSVQDTLIGQGIDARVVELPASTRTAEDAAKAIGCSVAQITKSLVFRTKYTGKAILVLASGINRVNEKLIAKEVGEEIIKADADFTREKTGFAIGGIPPIGHKQQLETYIDKDLLQYTEIWAAAGTPNAVFNLKSALIQGLTRGRVISISY